MRGPKGRFRVERGSTSSGAHTPVFVGGVPASESNGEVCAPAHEDIRLCLEALQNNERSTVAPKAYEQLRYKARYRHKYVYCAVPPGPRPMAMSKELGTRTADVLG